jgi:ribosomal protein L31
MHFYMSEEIKKTKKEKKDGFKLPNFKTEISEEPRSIEYNGKTYKFEKVKVVSPNGKSFETIMLKGVAKEGVYRTEVDPEDHPAWNKDGGKRKIIDKSSRVRRNTL